MTSHDFRKIYTRPTRVQDLEHYIVNPVFLLPNNPLREVVYIAREGKWEAWYREDEIMKWIDGLVNRLLSKEWSIEKHLVDFDRDRGILENCTNELVEKSRIFETKEVLAAYEKVFAGWIKFVDYLWMPWAITLKVEEIFVERLKEKYPRWQDMYNALAVATKPIQMQILIEELLQWKIDGEEEAVIEKLAVEYGYLAVYSVNESGWTAADLPNQIAEIKDPQAELLKMKKERKEAIESVNKVFEQLKDEQELLELAKTIHEYVYLRTERIDVYKWTRLHDAKFYRAFEKHFDLDQGWAGHLTRSEIISALKSGELPAKEIMSARAEERYAVYLVPGETRVITDEQDIKSFVESKIPDYYKSEQKNFVEGKPAFKGKISGKVRLILRLDEVPSMKKGEILVANMTHPDYMPAIHKAAGIVTDEGGIVCHAAIISRELKIPCVMGTGEATKIFKTGEMVEVDADNGVVRRV